MPRQEMMVERMLRIAPVVITIVSGAFIAMLLPNGTIAMGVLLVTAVVAVVVGLRGRRTPDRR